MANKYLQQLRISSASIDPRRDRDRFLGFVAGWQASHPVQSVKQGQAEERQELIRIMSGILKEPYGCPMCDSGKLRSPEKQHWPECFFYQAQNIIENEKSASPVPSDAVEFLNWVQQSEYRLNPHSKEERWRTADQILSVKPMLNDGITTEQLYQLFKEQKLKQ